MNGTEKTILVVDDNPFITDVFETMLTRGGYKSVTANSGKECLEILKKQTPDLILLDIMMEPMDGWETLEKIKENPKTKNIPVLMLTAKQLTPPEAAEYGILIEDYVLKPITTSELYSAIENALVRKQEKDVDEVRAKDSGVDSDLVKEYALLCKSIDVNKRLMQILEKTYHFKQVKSHTKEEIPQAVKNMEKALKFQEERLAQIKEELKNYPGFLIINCD